MRRMWRRWVLPVADLRVKDFVMPGSYEGIGRRSAGVPGGACAEDAAALQPLAGAEGGSLHPVRSV